MLHRKQNSLLDCGRGVKILLYQGKTRHSQYRFCQYLLNPLLHCRLVRHEYLLIKPRSNHWQGCRSGMRARERDYYLLFSYRCTEPSFRHASGAGSTCPSRSSPRVEPSYRPGVEAALLPFRIVHFSPQYFRSYHCCNSDRHIRGSYARRNADRVERCGRYNPDK